MNMFTASNYLEKSCLIPVSKLPEPLKKGHALALKAFDSKALAYTSNDIVRASMDHYLLAINEFMAVKDPKRQPVAAQKQSVQAKANREIPGPHRSSAKGGVEGNVERIPEEIRFIRRYAAMHGKVTTKLTVMRLLTSMQKAMLEKRIRRTSPFAQEILQIQDQLISCANRMDEQAEISIGAKQLLKYKEIASSQRIRASIALLKAFVSIHGRVGVEQKADRLVKAIERMVKSGTITKKDPYAAKLNEAYKSLRIYQRDKKAFPEIKQSELNGIIGLLGVDTKKPTQSKSAAPGVISSAELLNMDFETIGLTGRFKELIGDPSVGFTAMVFGQPKSGKSTLMLEFAHHLAVHHGKVLYAAIEEGYGYTLKEKVSRIRAVHPRLSIAESLPKDLAQFDFVFIDSVSRAGMELEDLVKLKKRNPRTSFVCIFHSTKDGKFRGGNELAHEVDVIVEVVDGKAKGHGRFGLGELAFKN